MKLLQLINIIPGGVGCRGQTKCGRFSLMWTVDFFLKKKKKKERDINLTLGKYLLRIDKNISEVFPLEDP